jgi:hypothetical protein
LRPRQSAPKSDLTKEQHANDIKKIHERGAELIPAEYLICHQSDPELAHKIRARAKQRMAIRNAKRLAHK